MVPYFWVNPDVIGSTAYSAPTKFSYVPDEFRKERIGERIIKKNGFF